MKAYDEKRANAKYSIGMIPEPDTHSIYFPWDEGGIAVRLSEIRENHQGLTADFAAECPIGTEVKSGIKVLLDRDANRKSTIKAMHDAALGLDFKEWDALIEHACSETVRAYKETRAQAANEVPEALYPDEILALDTPETPWLVKDFLVDVGITILASIPKKGKTVIALNLVKAAQDGTKFLDRDIPKVPILFLALEDPWARLKRRMQMIGISGKQNPFVVTCDLTQGLDPLRRLDEKYNPRIIVVDTLLAALRIKDENSPDLGIAVQGLSDFAKERERSFLVLHHHGKTKRDDPVLDLRGHTSLSGAVDVILGLYPEDTPGQFKLKSASRDGESLDLDLAYDGSTLKWAIDTNYNELQKIDSDAQMFEVLNDLGAASIDAICQANGKSRPVNDKVLKRLMDAGDVTRDVSKAGFQPTYLYKRVER